MKGNNFSRMVYLLVIILPFSLFLLPSIQGKSLFWGVSSLQFIPWRGLAMDSILHGQMPFINPYNGLGSPLLANYQLALFYPLNWLQLPIYAAWGNPGLAASYNLLVPLHLIPGCRWDDICSLRRSNSAHLPAVLALWHFHSAAISSRVLLSSALSGR